ncbi:hypothetical protein D3C78_1887810 [compost metagenome]
MKVPGVIGPAFRPRATLSAPITSLLNTLPLRLVTVSEAVLRLLSFIAFGTSSTMFTSMVLVTMLPSESVA